MCRQETAEPAATDSSKPVASRVGGLGDLLRQVEVVPADDRVLDQPLAPLGHLLVRLLGLVQFASVADRDRPRELVEFSILLS